MKDKPFKAAPNRREWYGFNLLQGHIFGIYEGVPYVSNAAPGPRPGTICAYQCTITPDCFHWEQVTIPAASELGKLLIVAQAYTPTEARSPCQSSGTTMSGLPSNQPPIQSARGIICPDRPLRRFQKHG